MTSHSSYWRRFVQDAGRLSPEEWLAKWGEGYTTAAWRTGPRRRDRVISWLNSILELVSTKPQHLWWWWTAEGRVVRRVLKSQGRRLNSSALSHVHALRLVQRRRCGTAQTACVIGDGLGLLTASLLRSPEYRKVIVVNLEEMIPFDRLGLRRAGYEPDELESTGRLTILGHREAGRLASLAIDVFFNLSSFQEMSHSAIRDYFNLMRGRGSLLYCMNRLEKVLADEGPIRFFDYPWEGTTIIDQGSADWHWTALSATRPLVRHREPHRFVLTRFSGSSRGR